MPSYGLARITFEHIIFPQFFEMRETYVIHRTGASRLVASYDKSRLLRTYSNLDPNCKIIHLHEQINAY